MSVRHGAEISTGCPEGSSLSAPLRVCGSEGEEVTASALGLPVPRGQEMGPPPTTASPLSVSFSAMGDQPADALRRWISGPLQQAGGRLLLLLAGGAPAPAAPRAARSR